MTVMIVGMVMFFGIHLVPLTPLRAMLQKSLGENPYKMVFSLIALVGLGLMIWGFSLARAGADGIAIIYSPPEWGRYATYALMLASLIAFGASHGKGYLKLWLRQPMSVAVALWAVAHLLVNGRLVEVLIFGGLLVFSLLDIVSSELKGKVPNHQPRLVSDVIAVVAGVVIYWLVSTFHFSLFGVTVA